MKSTISAIALVAAALLPTVSASPLNLHQREAEADIQFDIVTDVEVATAWATVFATEGEAPAWTKTAPVAETTTVAAYKGGMGHSWNHQWHKQETTTTAAPPPPPPPTTTSTYEAPAPTTTAEPTTTYQAPAWTPPPAQPTTTTQAPAPAPTDSWPAPSAYTGDDSYDDANLQDAIINSTNTYRVMFQASPMTWNQSLVDMAVASAAKCDFEHSVSRECWSWRLHAMFTDNEQNAGQNLAAGYSGPQAAVGGWGDEYKDFNFASPDFGETTGHFTQLVWQDSTTTGCAAKKCPTDGSTGASGW